MSMEELGMDVDTSKRAMLETITSPGLKPRRRGRPRRKSREGEVDHPKAELSAHLTLKKSLMLTKHSGLVRTARKGGRRRNGREKASGTTIENSAQQLEQDQLAIVELYQENREL
jgi:hypothetical protein